jgi:hypothetical protein
VRPVAFTTLSTSNYGGEGVIERNDILDIGPDSEPQRSAKMGTFCVKYKEGSLSKGTGSIKRYYGKPLTELDKVYSWSEY